MLKRSTPRLRAAKLFRLRQAREGKRLTLPPWRSRPRRLKRRLGLRKLLT